MHGLRTWDRVFTPRNAVLLGLFLSVALANQAAAWKPSTHVYLALRALDGIMSTVGLDGAPKEVGSIVIYRVNHVSGDIIGRIGEYPADQSLVSALEDHRGEFIAGVLGPDAYPDIATGQVRIHVEEPQHSGLWLKHLWDRAIDEDADIRAFVAGYLIHGAGDMFMHTFVNHYAGGAFVAGENGVRHVILESYIGERAGTLDPAEYDLDVSQSVLDFVYETLIDARAGTYLGNQLLVEQPITEASAQTSVPRIFSSLRNLLQQQVEAYDAVLDGFDQQIDDIYLEYEEASCGDKTCTSSGLTNACIAACGFAAAQSAPIAAQKDAYILLNGGQTDFARAWIDDIDDGLRAWADLNHDLALLLLLNPDGMDLQGARERAEEYKNEHLLSMIGAPDVVGESIIFVNSMKELFGFEYLNEQLQLMQESLVDFILVSTYGKTAEEIRDMIINPAVVFDNVLTSTHYDSDNQRLGNSTSLAALTQDVLGLPDEGFGNDRWDAYAFAPAYNTITMTQLVLMSEEGIQQLRQDLNCELQSCSFMDNAMLGFIRSLDDDNQWRNVPPMAFGECAEYGQIFKRQHGEEALCPSTIPLVAPTITPPGSTFAQPAQVTLAHPKPDVMIYYTINEVDNVFEPDPTSNRSRLYTQPFSISAPLSGGVRPFQVRARAFQAGFPPSPSATESFTIDARVAAPQITPAGGEFIEPAQVQITPAEGSTVYYTVDGQVPDYNATPYTAPLQLGKGTHTVKAVAYRIQYAQSEVVEATFDVFDGNTDQVDAPVLDPFSSGDFTTSVEVSMLTHTQGAQVRYTVAEDQVPENPTTASTLYTAPFTLGLGNWFVRAVAFKEGEVPSQLNQRNYRVADPIGTTTAPQITPNGGVFHNDVTVTLSSSTNPPTQGVRIFYTTDGSEPVALSQAAGNYSDPFDVTESLTLQAQATRTFFSPSDVSSSTFNLVCASPEISPGEGTFPDSVLVRMETETEDATIRYTIDGTEPNEESLAFSGPFMLAHSAAVQARAYKKGYTFSETSSANLHVTGSAGPTVVAQPADRSVVVGDTARFVVKAAGLPEPDVQWQFDGIDLPGATADTLVVAQAAPEDGGGYQAILQNSKGIDSSRIALLSVNPVPLPPTITTQPASMTVEEGEPAALEVAASGTPDPQYVWYRNGYPLPAQTKNSIAFEEVRLAHSGAYFVTATNGAGVDTSLTAVLTVEVATTVSTVDEPNLPLTFSLNQNYPNPFNPTTTIPFALPERGRVTLRLFDLQGRLIAILVDREMAAGRYHAEFDAAGLASGPYLYQLRAGSRVKSKVMVMVR